MFTRRIRWAAILAAVGLTMATAPQQLSQDYLTHGLAMRVQQAQGIRAPFNAPPAAPPTQYLANGKVITATPGVRLPFNAVPIPSSVTFTQADALTATWPAQRGENPNPFLTPQIKQGAQQLALGLGLTLEDANNAAIAWANDHFAQFHQFPTEATAPEIVWDEIQARLATAAGKTPVRLTDAQRATAAQAAQTRQEDLKARDQRIEDAETYQNIVAVGKTIASAFIPGGGALVSLYSQVDPNKPDNPYATPVTRARAVSVVAGSGGKLSVNQGALLMADSQDKQSAIPANTGAAVKGPAAAAAPVAPILMLIALAAVAWWATRGKA